MLCSSFDLRRRESGVAMLSQKSRRRMSSPSPASRGVERASAAVADRRGRATEQRARRRTSHGRARSPECSASRSAMQRSKRRLAAPAGRKQKFSSLQTIENKRNRIGIPPSPPTFRGSRCHGGDRLAEPKGVAMPRPSSASFAGNRRAGGCGAAKFSYPQTLEKARNGEGIWLAVAPRAGSSRRSGERRVRLQRFHSSGSAETGVNSQCRPERRALFETALGGAQIAKASISAAPYPHSASTSAVCSPSRGGRRRIEGGVADISIGLEGRRSMPSVSCSIRFQKPMLSK